MAEAAPRLRRVAHRLAAIGLLLLLAACANGVDHSNSDNDRQGGFYGGMVGGGSGL